MSQRMNIPTTGICLCVFAALSSLGCDVGRSVLAPLNDASSDMTLPPSDGPTDGATDGSLLDVRAGTRTCSDFVACASSCAAGSGFAACVSNCARELRPASQPLFDSFATCIRASCDGGIDDGQCAGSMATLTACGAQLRACSADGAPADGGTDVPATDTPATDTPATDTPATDTPATDTPATDTPATDGPPSDGGVDAAVDAPRMDVPVTDVPVTDAPVDTTVPADLPIGGLGCTEGIMRCVPSCPERDVDCVRRCASGMRAASMTTFNNLITCLTGACGSVSSFSCFQAVGSTLCASQLMACMADSAGTAPAPACGTATSQAGESSCGGMCVNTSYRNTANCGLCGAACAASETCSFGACVPHGVTNLALQWAALGDVDLVVHTPCGNVVSARNTTNCGATFDRSNSTGIGPESISFAATPMAGRYIVCAIPRTTLRGDRPSARLLIDRTGMPLTLFPLPALGAPTDRLGGEFTVLSTTVDTTTDDCTATSPFHLADIDL